MVQNLDLDLFANVELSSSNTQTVEEAKDDLQESNAAE